VYRVSTSLCKRAIAGAAQDQELPAPNRLILGDGEVKTSVSVEIAGRQSNRVGLWKQHLCRTESKRSITISEQRRHDGGTGRSPIAKIHDCEIETAVAVKIFCNERARTNASTGKRNRIFE